MNLYLNDVQTAFLKELIDKPTLEVTGGINQAEELIAQIKAKLNKKKIDKKVKLPTATFVDSKGRELSFYPRSDNGAMIIKANKSTFPSSHKEAYSFYWDREISIKIVNFLHDYAIFTGDDEYEVYPKAYSEEFNVFKEEVERSISLSGTHLSFICYTGDKEDDDWSYLLPGRVKETLRIMVAYLFLHEKAKEILPLLHRDIQEKYPYWLSKKE